jgi:pantetheine-phosphate adenylyltransferase
MALTNRKLNPDLDTVFLASDASYTYLSSSIVKNVAYHGGDISNFVPACIHDEIFQRIYSERK